jgi:hypothetical protein
MHYLFNLFKIKGPYVFRALLAHPQEALHPSALGILRARYVSWLHKGWSGSGVGDTSSKLHDHTQTHQIR